MRWLAVAVLLLAVGCGSSDDGGGERGFDELFDAALELFCPQPTTDDCRNTATANLAYLTTPPQPHDFTSEDILAVMVDEMDASQFDSFTDAASEALDQLIADAE